MSATAALVDSTAFNFSDFMERFHKEEYCHRKL